MVTLEDIKNQTAEYSDKTFGEDRTYSAPLIHLKKEADNAIENGNIEDFVDMLCLLLDAYRKRFPELKTQTLLDFCDEKQKIIIPARNWGKVDEKGMIKHLSDTYAKH